MCTGIVAVNAIALAVPANVSANWAVTASGLPGLNNGAIWSVAFDPNPSDAAIALAATDNGVYRSTDSGSTWKQVTAAGSRAWQVGFDANGRGFAGLDHGGIRRSDDKGATWVDVSAGLTNNNVRALAFGDGVVAATSDGVAFSSDGAHWQMHGLSGYDISAVAIASNSPFTVIAGADNGNLSSGFVFRNTNADPNWETLQNGLPLQATQGISKSAPTITLGLAAGPLPTNAQKRPLELITNAGAYHSADGGTTWARSAGLADAFTASTAIFGPLSPTLIYLGGDGSGASGGDLLRSTDQGASFSPFHDGLANDERNIESIAVAPTNPVQVLAAVNRPGKSSEIVRQTDPSAPVGGSAAENLTSIPTPAPTPTARVHATPPPQLQTPAKHTSVKVPGFLRWPFPLAVEIFSALLILYILVRWRQRYLDVEGPP